MYGVLKPKKMFGKEVVGTERSTFIINKEGMLVKEFRKVNLKGHVKEVLDFLIEVNNKLVLDKK
ncbi:peroxiredoxin Q/BCP [Alkaliphilus peptidifermentans DSM 18978]|uniref:Peroxiredoxin Q/BCP n=1 Tax=Alkaliphilus peptidifermentans DSM 18978 TaxID=1120976 RepID=A0A1G5CNP5_9FIRM|nr:peroxiredoxin Q/BCP [Alkaliphilus peptidifermentans DSM 18978]